MIIIIHSSKTMARVSSSLISSFSEPRFIKMSVQLHGHVKALTKEQIMDTMSVSELMSAKVLKIINEWSADTINQSPAIFSFTGDIYSGLKVRDWTYDDLKYANDKLIILSGLYGLLRPLDGIFPYRLEMGYKLAINKVNNLYEFWGNAITACLNSKEPIINLAAVEYSKVITNFTENSRITTPVFLTVDTKTKEPAFVTVHTKIARGAFANWVIKNRVEQLQDLHKFNDLGYSYNSKLSSTNRPVFICQKFGGIGLSIRKIKA